MSDFQRSKPAEKIRLDSTSASRPRRSDPAFLRRSRPTVKSFFERARFFFRARDKVWKCIPTPAACQAQSAKKIPGPVKAPGKSNARFRKARRAFPRKRNFCLYRIRFALSNAFFSFLKIPTRSSSRFRTGLARSCVSAKKKPRHPCRELFAKIVFRASAQSGGGLYSFDSDVSTGFYNFIKN